MVAAALVACPTCLALRVVALRSLAGARGYEVLIKRVAASDDPRRLLRRYYSSRWWTNLLYPLAVADARFRHNRDFVAEWENQT